MRINLWNMKTIEFNQKKHAMKIIHFERIFSKLVKYYMKNLQNIRNINLRKKSFACKRKDILKNTHL